MFALVHFVQTNDIAVVPVLWLSGKYCFWPNSKDAVKLAKAMHSPKSDWQKHEVIVKSIYASYDEARRFENRFEDTSNLESEQENLGKGKRGKRKRPFEPRNDSSSDEESVSLLALPPFPVEEMPPIPVPVQEMQESPSVPYTVLAVNEASLSEPNSIGQSSGPTQSAMMREILNIKLQVKQQNEMISSVLAALNTLIERTSRPEPAKNLNVLPVRLPLKTMEELLQLEDCLNDNETKELLYEILTRTGGISLGNLVRRMLSRLLTNELAVKFSWLGAKEKEAFSNLKLSKLIFSAARRNPLFKHVTDQEIETVIKDWLRHAKARNTSRQKENCEEGNL